MAIHMCTYETIFSQYIFMKYFFDPKVLKTNYEQFKFVLKFTEIIIIISIHIPNTKSRTRSLRKISHTAKL